MLHIDYNWDLYPDSIVFDQELNIDPMGWKSGDCFKLVVEDNGRTKLVKIDPLEKFIRGIE